MNSLIPETMTAEGSQHSQYSYSLNRFLTDDVMDEPMPLYAKIAMLGDDI